MGLSQESSHVTGQMSCGHSAMQGTSMGEGQAMCSGKTSWGMASLSWALEDMSGMEKHICKGDTLGGRRIWNKCMEVGKSSTESSKGRDQATICWGSAIMLGSVNKAKT